MALIAGVQGRVGRNEPFRVVGGQCVQSVLLQLPQPVDVLGGGVLGGEPGRVRLQDRADAEKLVHLVLGGGVHERALRGAEVDPAVGLQTLQGFTHRLPADAEVLGQFVFDQVLAPLQGALHDQVHDRVVDGLAQGRGTLHPARGSVGQRVMLRAWPRLRDSGWEVTSRFLRPVAACGQRSYRLSYAINCLRMSCC